MYIHTAGFTPGRWQSKIHLTIDERGSKLIETVFSIAMCHQLATNGNRELFLVIFNLRLSIVLTF